MNNEEIFPRDTLRALCIKHDWFTSGSLLQYNKLFTMNDKGSNIHDLAYNKLFTMNDKGSNIHDLAIVIWICSSTDESISEIEKILEEHLIK